MPFSNTSPGWATSSEVQVEFRVVPYEFGQVASCIVVTHDGKGSRKPSFLMYWYTTNGDFSDRRIFKNANSHLMSEAVRSRIRPTACTVPPFSLQCVDWHWAIAHARTHAHTPHLWMDPLIKNEAKLISTQCTLQGTLTPWLGSLSLVICFPSPCYHCLPHPCNQACCGSRKPDYFVIIQLVWSFLLLSLLFPITPEEGDAETLL